MTYAAALDSARRLKATMERWGVRCSIELQVGRGSDPWATPVKYHRMHHHTVSRYSPGGTPVLALVKRGRSDVPGPLANGYGGYDHVYRIICMGLANHPGRGGPVTIDGVRIPADSARAPTWGTEWEGGIQRYEDIPGMLEFMGRSDCALAEWSGRPITSQMEHSTWAPARKIDRLYFTRERGIALARQWFPAPITKDWFDMATEADLRRVVTEARPAPGYFAVSTSNSPVTYYVAADHQSKLTMERAGGLHKWIKSLHEIAGLSGEPVIRPQAQLDEIPDSLDVVAAVEQAMETTRGKQLVGRIVLDALAGGEGQEALETAVRTVLAEGTEQP